MMDGADAVPDRVGADAVLRVHDVVVAGPECLPQHLDRADDPLSHRFRGVRLERNHLEVHARIDRTEERAVAAASQRPHGHLRAGPGQRLGEIQGVHDPAAWLGGVGEQRDAHQRVPFSRNRLW